MNNIEEIINNKFKTCWVDKRSNIAHIHRDRVEELKGELNTEVQKEREEAVREFAKEIYKATKADVPDVVTLGELNDILMRTVVEVGKRTESWWLDEYLKENKQ